MSTAPRLSRGMLDRIVATLRVGLRRLRSAEAGRYRPELYYMRGPGPRALAKRGLQAGAPEPHSR